MYRGQQLCFSGLPGPEAMLRVNQNTIIHKVLRNTRQGNWPIVFWVTFITFLEDAEYVCLSPKFWSFSFSHGCLENVC